MNDNDNDKLWQGRGNLIDPNEPIHVFESSSGAAAASTTMALEEMIRECANDAGEIVGDYRIRQFAALIRAQALEDAAVICEAEEERRWDRREGEVAERCAAAIRSIK